MEIFFYKKMLVLVFSQHTRSNMIMNIRAHKYLFFRTMMSKGNNGHFSTKFIEKLKTVTFKREYRIESGIYKYTGDSKKHPIDGHHRIKYGVGKSQKYCQCVSICTCPITTFYEFGHQTSTPKSTWFDNFLEEENRTCSVDQNGKTMVNYPNPISISVENKKKFYKTIQSHEVYNRIEKDPSTPFTSITSHPTLPKDTSILPTTTDL